MASNLEAEMLFAIKAVGLPAPITERHFDWCCECPKKAHEPESVVAGSGWVGHAICHGCFATHTNAEQRGGLHAFRHGRAFRFDLCWPTQMLAVELDGATWTGGRHTRGAGFQSDAEKRNLAQLLGWRVLTFTRRDVTSGLALEQIEMALKAATA